MKHAALLIYLLLLTACRLEITPIVVDWDHAPGTLVVEADTVGGPISYEATLNHVPHARVWGDGRVVWVERRDDGSSVVWEGHLPQEALSNLLRFVVEEGFFDWQDHYQPQGPADNLPFSHITVNMIDRSKTVSQYFEGAPVGFWRIYRRIGQDVPDAHPLTPQRGLLRAWPRDDSPATTPAIPWPADAGFALADVVVATRWIEGPLVAFVWDGLRQRSDEALFADGGVRYALTLQVPGLSWREPQDE